MYLTQSLHRSLRARADSVAVYYNGDEWTYREHGHRVARLAGALRSLGIRAGERVAMLSANSVQYIEYIFGVPWAGGTLNPINIRWSAAEIAYSLDDSDTKLLIVDRNYLHMIDDIKKRSKSLETVIFADTCSVPDGLISYEKMILETDPVEDAYRSFNDLLGLFYTGGTTGLSKGVMLSHTNVCSSVVSLSASGLCPPGCKFLNAAPMFHMAGFSTTLAASLVGGTHYILPGFEASQVLSAIEEEKITDVVLVPTMLQMLLQDENFAKSDLSSLRRIMYGASPMPLGTLDDAIRAMPSVGFIQAYGMTELAPFASTNGPENHSQQARESGRIRSAGQAGILQEVKILDDQGSEVPCNVVGEVAVRGPNVMLGYWGNETATSQAIVDGWMHTGDVGYLDDEGYIYIIDRLKDMIISGGENVYSSEVETVISLHPAVANCAVIGTPSKEWGESVHAVIIPKEGQSIRIDELRVHCREHIAGYKCPRSLSLIEEFPLSAAGKILKTELRKMFCETLAGTRTEGTVAGDSD